jgi:hypothetical protein
MILLLRSSTGGPATTVRYWPMLALTTVIAGGGAIGALNQTLDDTTLAATAQAPVAAQLAATLDDTQVSALALTGTGSAAVIVTLDDTTIAATAVAPLSASLGVTLAETTLIATADTPDSERLATLAVTLSDVTIAASASTEDFGRVLGGGRLQGPQSSATVRLTDS